MILNDAGYDVLTANNARGSFTKAEEENPDLILMDIIMLSRNGFDACKLLKFKPATKEIPVIMFSALKREVDKNMAFESRASDYIVKPFNRKVLLGNCQIHRLILSCYTSCIGDDQTDSVS
jgi:DNA-binding response OmpR family regulator